MLNTLRCLSWSSPDLCLGNKGVNVRSYLMRHLVSHTRDMEKFEFKFHPPINLFSSPSGCP